MRLIGLERIKNILSTQKPRWTKERLAQKAEVIQALLFGSLAYATLHNSDKAYESALGAVKTAGREPLVS